MKSKLSIIAGTLSYKIAQKIGKSGTALPGKVAMKIDKNILLKLSKNCNKIIFITGTNGKTTTNNISNHIFKGKYNKVVSNLTGSNMIQGIITPLVLNSKEKYDWGIFEVDEGSIPIVTKYITPDYLLITNFFRDQLDRYGEVENTVKLVHDAINNEKTTLILNSDDPTNLYFNDLKNPKIYYSQNKTQLSKDTVEVGESIFCPICGNRLNYEYINYGSIGKYYCNSCGAKNPKAKYQINKISIEENSYNFEVQCNEKKQETQLNILGTYNLYNALGAIALSCECNINLDTIKNQIKSFKYERGRMEPFKIHGEKIILGLSKNPVGLSEVLRTINYNKNETSIMFILNDYPPDGEDISWIWDANFEEILKMQKLNKFYCVGTRAEEIGLRLKYEGICEEKIIIYSSKNKTDIENPIEKLIYENGTKYIIGTFTAMPEARKILVDKSKNTEEI